MEATFVSIWAIHGLLVRVRRPLPVVGNPPAICPQSSPTPVAICGNPILLYNTVFLSCSPLDLYND
jgi:hypothetical protein